jgi:hypothetical protein
MVKLYAPPTNPITTAALDSLAQGVTIVGIRYGSMKASILVLITTNYLYALTNVMLSRT